MATDTKLIQKVKKYYLSILFFQAKTASDLFRLLYS